jgi:hypothetical protein
MILTKEQEKQLIDMYKAGITIENIIEIFGCKERTLREVLKKYQIDRVYNTFSEELYSRIIDLYINKNFTQSKICCDLLISSGCIGKTLDKNNLPKRTYSDANKRFGRNSHYFDEIDTPNKAYILGMLYADGCNNRTHNAIHLQLQEEDKNILKRIKNELEYEGKLRFNPLHEKNQKHKNSYILCINDEHMSKRLESLV